MLKNYVIKIRKFLVELIFPAFCLECKKEGSFWCDGCFGKVEVQKEQVCPLCYAVNVDGSVCELCKKKDFYLDQLLVVSPLVPHLALLRSVHYLKYDFVTDLAAPLGKLLGKIYLKYLAEIDDILICPIPLHEKRLLWRGFNQAALLAEETHEELVQFRKTQSNISNTSKYFMDSKNFPIISDLLKRVHFQKPQMELSREERLKNVVNAFEINDHADFLKSQNSLSGKIDVKNKIVLLLDDVATTLSTLNSAAQVLKNAGAEKVLGLVLVRSY